MSSLINRTGKSIQADSKDAPKIEFPCDNYMVKIVAVESEQVLELLAAIVEKHAPDVDHKKVTSQRSSKGRFISYTYRIRATGEEQLAALHKELISHDVVKMVL